MGPLIAGRIFDLRASYSDAFEIFVVLLIVGSAAALACVPMPSEEAGAAAASARA